MPSKTPPPELPSPEELEQIYLERQNLMFICGVILLGIYQALEMGELIQLKLMMSQFAHEDSSRLSEMKLNGFAHPFKDLKPQNIMRYPDEVWAKSLLDPDSSKVSIECPCAVVSYRGEICLRWTIPGMEYIWQCDSIEKLAYTAMVIIEELLHIRQVISLNAHAIIVLSTMLEFDMITDTSKMDKEDADLLSQVLENDVLFFLNTYFKRSIEQIQWFTDRIGATDMHKLMTPAEFIDAIIKLVSKYGYPHDLAATLIVDIEAFSLINPELGAEMLKASSLNGFVNSEG
jgi:hypothetical protein